jgi:hypothetical protein
MSTPSGRHRRDYNVVYSVAIIGDKVNGFVSIVADGRRTILPVQLQVG